jgi:hypothetical protein
MCSEILDKIKYDSKQEEEVDVKDPSPISNMGAPWVRSCLGVTPLWAAATRT